VSLSQPAAKQRPDLPFLPLDLVIWEWPTGNRFQHAVSTFSKAMRPHSLCINIIASYPLKRLEHATIRIRSFYQGFGRGTRVGGKGGDYGARVDQRGIRGRK
jgi:hypothetical protein